MKEYKITKDVKVPADTNIYVSVYAANDDDDFRLAGFTFMYLDAEVKYNGEIEKEDQKMGRGKDIAGQTVTAVTSITKFKVDVDDDDDLPDNCEVKYKLVIEAGDDLLLEEKISDKKEFHFVVTATINLKK